LRSVRRWSCSCSCRSSSSAPPATRPWTGICCPSCRRSRSWPVRAGLGWLTAWPRTDRDPRWPAWFALGVVVGQLALLVPYLPDGMTYYSPLLGGAAAAARVFTIGQGEGLDEAACYLDAEPGRGPPGGRRARLHVGLRALLPRSHDRTSR
jgi:hypothetical protein